MSRGQERSTCVPALVGAAIAFLVAPGCQRPVVGARTTAQTVASPQVKITAAAVDGTGHVAVTLEVKRGGVGLSLADLQALEPTFTAAVVGVHPVDGLRAWTSLLLTGRQTIPSLPPGGPGTPPAAVLTNVKQPGSESNGTWIGANGAFTYTFAGALPGGFVPTQTVRVGVFLAAVDGTQDTCATFDFVPAGGAPAPRDAVRDANCERCHVQVRHHDGHRVGVKLCLTCHTWQNADPDTCDPAAMYSPGCVTAATDPNPLDLGRLVHRIHRGKELPTLYTSTTTAPAPSLPSATPLPLPYEPHHGGVTPRNFPVAGRKYSVVGEMGREVIFAQVLNRRPPLNPDPTLTPRAVPGGILFPRDLRDCGVCHEGAPQEYEILYGISRRTCSGCHPEIWFQGSAITATDAVHFAHPGGPQPDDTQCRGCHVAAGPPPQKLYAPIAEIHVPPHMSPHFNRPTVEIVSVQNLRPGEAPTVQFRLYDRLGTLSPPNNPTPLRETGPLASATPRNLQSLSITMAGPTAPGYGGFPVTSGDPGNPSPITLTADANGVFTYQFVSTIPAAASGTWAVGMDGRRRITPTALYDTASDTFLWPYTGEVFASSETPENALVYVDTAVGTFTPGAPSTAVPRRTVVAQEKCERCHGRLLLHGTIRNKVQYCLLCHTPNRTDWAQRIPAAGANVNLAATYDGIEERSIDFKVMIHRIHTGARKGASSLEAIEPFVVYGVGKTPFFFDEGLFPNDLRNCTMCHEGQSYHLDAPPPDAPWTVANETSTVRHQATRDHVAGEPAMPPIRAACLSCHQNGFTEAHADAHTSSGVEQCAQCHVRGTYGVEVAHGLAAPTATTVGASFSSIAQNVLVPHCAAGACHGGNPPANFPQLDADAAYAALVQNPSQQAAGVSLVEPFSPDASYLVLKLRGDAGAVGGIATIMPIGDAALDASEIAAIEAWIANGAPND